MGKKKTLYDKLADIQDIAKKEIKDAMIANGDSKLDLANYCISVFVNNDKDTWHEYNVTYISIDENGALSFDYNDNGNSIWYYNPIVWIDLHNAVLRHYNLLKKMYNISFR